MYNLDAIEAINVDQLVTPLDRLLLRSGQLRSSRRSSDLTNEAVLAVAASARRAEARAEQTVYMRAASRVNVFAAAAFATVMSVMLIACLLA
jgi:hypothetical protein